MNSTPLPTTGITGGISETGVATIEVPMFVQTLAEALTVLPNLGIGMRPPSLNVLRRLCRKRQSSPPRARKARDRQSLSASIPAVKHAGTAILRRPSSIL